MAGKTKTRIYVVTDTLSNERSLVRATTKAQAVRRFVHDRVKAEPASQDAIIAAMSAGAPILEPITGDDE